MEKRVFRIAEMLESVIVSDLKDNNIMIIAATESLDLNEKLFTCRGKHYFKNVFNTTDLNKVFIVQEIYSARFFVKVF